MRHLTYKVAATVFLLLIFSVIGFAQGVVVSQTFTVEPGRYSYFQFFVSSAGTKVVGRFHAQGGRGNDIETFIVDEDGFENYSNRHQVRTYYNSGRVTVGTINTALNPGKYYLIFNNGFSTFSNKVVEAHVVLINYSAPAYTPRERRIVGSSTTKLLNVRSAPSPHAPVIGHVRKYEKLYVRRVLGSWTEIEWNGDVGYVLSRYVGY